MKNFNLPRKVFAWVMVLCLLMPTMTLAGSNAGKKNFNKGVKLDKSE